MNILITGANGQLGSELREAAAASSHHFIFTDLPELDITDAAAVSAKVRECAAQCIINCAAYTQVDRAEDDEVTADLINHQAVANLAKAAAESDALLIHISTDYVFGGMGNTPFAEGDATAPLGAYGRTKLAGEEAVRTGGCRYIILRTAWLYSTYGNNFVKTMRRLMHERDELKVVFDQVGTPTYAGDLAGVIIRLLDAPLPEDCAAVYHFTNEGVCSWFDFALAIQEYSGLQEACRVLPCRSSEFPSKVRRPSFSVLDKAAIRRDFGLSIPHWRASLAKCVARLDAAE